MKLLFCHDGPIEKTKDGIYYSVGFNDSLCKRYKVISEDISLAMRVHYTGFSDNGISKSHLLSKKYKVIECPNVSSAKGVVSNRMKCKKILEKAINDSDAVIVRLPSFIGNLAIDICKRIKKPYMVELVGCPWDSLRNRSLIGKIVAPIMYFGTRRRVKNSSYVIYVTKKFLQKRYPTNGESIFCSDVELPEVWSNTKPKKIDYDKIITLGTIGKLDVRYKGQQYVIKAMRRLKRSGLSVKYSIVGPGDSDYLRKIALKNGVIEDIEFCGELPHNRVFEWLKGVDVYIQPSTTEGMPRSLIEAMSAGCVCLASNVGGIPELLGEDFIFKSKSYREIAERVEKNIERPLSRELALNDLVVKEFKKETLDYKRNSFLDRFIAGVADE